MAINPSGFNMQSGLKFGGEPPTGGAGNYDFGNTMNANPSMPNANPYAVGHYAGGTSVSDFMPGSAPSGAPPGGGLPPNQLPWGMPSVSPVPGTSGQSTSDIWNTLGLPQTGQGNQMDFASDLARTYGKGTGSALFQYMERGAGFNSPITDQAIQAQDVAMQREAQQGWGNITSILGQSGINPNSSVEALSAGQYWGDVTAKENAMAAQEYYNMWSQSSGQEASLLQSIEGGSQQHQANKGGGIMDIISGTLGLGGDLFKAVFGAGDSNSN